MPELTLASRLEHARLQARAARLDRVVTVLRQRARDYGDRPTPSPLAHSLADFQRELQSVRAELTRVPTGDTP